MLFHDMDTIHKLQKTNSLEEIKEEKISFISSIFSRKKKKEKIKPEIIQNDEDNDGEKNIFYIFKKYPFASFFIVLLLLGFIYDRNRAFFQGGDKVETTTLSSVSNKTKASKKEKSTEKISLTNITVSNDKPKSKIVKAKPKKEIKIAPKKIEEKKVKTTPKKQTKTTEESKASNTMSKKEKILTLKRKSMGVISSDISFDILSDNTRLILSSIPYNQGNKIKEDFYVDYVGLKYNNEKSIEKMKLSAIIKHKGIDTPIRKLNRLVGDLYTINYYEDGIEINSNSSEKTSGIVLPGEKLSSEFKLKSVDMKDNKFAYKLIIKGDEHTFFVAEEKVQ